jgi:hypothetical protein
MDVHIEPDTTKATFKYLGEVFGRWYECECGVMVAKEYTYCPGCGRLVEKVEA